MTLQGKEFETISTDFCQAWVDTTKDGTNFLQKGGFDAVDEALEKGVVLVMSLWDDHFANMLWLDSIYPVDSTDPTNYRGSCDITSGVPADIEPAVGNTSSVIYSNIKYGPLGSTTGSSPSPSPATCTQAGSDPWSTGSHVSCCDGSTETLVHDATWHYICKAQQVVV